METRSSSENSLEIPSGALVIIDYYLLGSSQLERILAEDDTAQSITQIGGILISGLPERVHLQRDSPQSRFLLGDLVEDEHGALDEQCTTTLGEVWVDTRCVVFLDADLLRDEKLLAEYRSHLHASEFKPARDLLRSRGAAVRYGFSRRGETFHVRGNEGTTALVVAH